jgi:hypothetical protein
VIKKAAIAKGEVNDEDAGSVFELNNWNLGVRAVAPSVSLGCTCCSISHRKIAHNLHCNLPYLPSPKFAQVIYTILNLLGGVLTAILEHVWGLHHMTHAQCSCSCHGKGQSLRAGVLSNLGATVPSVVVLSPAWVVQSEGWV